MKQDDTPRFEFRLFGNALCETVEKALPDQAAKEITRESDIYLLSDATDVNLKIRDNKLNTKVLMRRQQGLECWQPHLDLAFPLAASFLREILFPLLQVQPSLSNGHSYTLYEFLDLMAITADVRLVRVHKQRYHYRFHGCQVELSTLYVAEQFYTRTAALEAVDPLALQSLRREIGLLGTENVNYNLGLKRLLQANPRLAERVVAEPYWEAAPISVELATSNFVLF